MSRMTTGLFVQNFESVLVEHIGGKIWSLCLDVLGLYVCTIKV